MAILQYFTFLQLEHKGNIKEGHYYRTLFLSQYGFQGIIYSYHNMVFRVKSLWCFSNILLVSREWLQIIQALRYLKTTLNNTAAGLHILSLTMHITSKVFVENTGTYAYHMELHICNIN